MTIQQKIEKAGGRYMGEQQGTDRFYWLNDLETNSSILVGEDWDINEIKLKMAKRRLLFWKG